MSRIASKTVVQRMESSERIAKTVKALEPKRILHLTLLKGWFDEIASGRKTEEYRKRTDYWQKRLLKPHENVFDWEAKEFDEVHFRNGYAKNAPFMRVEWKGCALKDHAGYGPVFAIQLGKVLELRNWPLNLDRVREAMIALKRARKGREEEDGL